MTFRERLDQLLAALAAEPHRYPHAELARAEEELRRYAEAESADAAAGSYAGRAERVEARLTAVADLIANHEGDEWAAHPATAALRGILNSEEYAIAQPEPWLHITFTSPDETTANTSALAIADHLRAEFDGVSMRISSNAVEATPPAPRDPCPFCESSPSLIPRVLMAGHVATVHPEVQTLDTTASDPAATEATDIGTEFVQQLDHPDDEALAKFEADLAQSGVDTPGCDCGHDGMGVRWHARVCAWRSTPPCDHCGVRGHSFEGCPGNATDETEAGIDQAMAGGVPVQIVTAPLTWTTAQNFYEADEDPASVKARFDAGEKGITAPPVPRFTAHPVTPEMERAATERARQAAVDSERSTAWFATTGGVITSGGVIGGTDGQPCSCGGRWPIHHLHADQHRPISPEQPERTTPDNPPTSSEWTPPPPGDRREQLPDAVLALIPDKPYLSTACDTAQQLEQAPRPKPTNGGAIPDVGWYVGMLHSRCRRNQKFTGALCVCGCHPPKEQP